MLDQFLRVKDTVDIYISSTDAPDRLRITFHRLTTRERLELVAGKSVAQFLALLDGKRSVREGLLQLGNFDEQAALKLLSFLGRR